MKRSLGIHAALLVLSACAGVFVWTRDKAPKALAQGETTVWSGRSADVGRIAFEGKTHKVTIEAKRDERGRYFVAVSEKDPPKTPPKADAGAEDAAPPAERVTTTFVSVGSAEKLADALAPLHALRALGRIPDDRAAEFGFTEPEGTLTVSIGGSEHKLVFGGPTPGGSDRYARDPASGEAFVLKGDLYRDVDSADSRLLEHELHEFKDTEVHKAHIVAAGKARDLARGGPDGKRFWADAASPDQKDETIGNWMSKLDRLHPVEYATAAPATKEVVARIEYAAGGPLGWAEVVKAPSAGGKPDYFIQTERTRLYGKVTQSLGEQVEQDIGSIVR